jgi:hypothetical protein
MKLPLALLFLLAVTGSVHAIHDTFSFEEDEKTMLGADEEEDRLLALSCGANNYYYSTTIDLRTEVALSCTSTEQRQIGLELNTYYDSVVSLDTALSNLELKTQVCANPTRRRRGLRLDAIIARQEDEDAHEENDPFHRELLFSSRFKYGGGGTCRLCPIDSADRKLEEQHEPHYDQGHRNLAITYTTLGFDTDSVNKKLNDGDYVPTNCWEAQYGMRVSVENANGGYAPSQKARIFDSAKANGDAHLGSPNDKCPGGGPGNGSGGEPGKLGENCIPQGNVLIIQESNRSTPKANSKGGTLLFSFDSPTRVGHIGVIDIERGAGWLEIQTTDYVNSKVTFTGQGSNGVQIVPVSEVVRQIKVVMVGGGAVTEVGIFTPSTAQEALSPTLRSYIRKMAPFEEYIPYLEFDLSYYLTRKINELYRLNTESCLYRKWADIDVRITALPKPPSVIC